METKWTDKDGINIVEINGKIDSSTAPELSRSIETKINESPGDLAIDFSGVDYISSAGLRVVLKANQLLTAKDSKLMLCSLKDYVREVFDLAGLSTILDIRESAAEI